VLLISNVLKEFLDLSTLEDKCITFVWYVGINNPTIECNILEELNLKLQHWKPQLAQLKWIFLFLAKHSNFKVNLVNLSSWKPSLCSCYSAEVIRVSVEILKNLDLWNEFVTTNSISFTDSWLDRIWELKSNIFLLYARPSTVNKTARNVSVRLIHGIKVI